ncbi:MAG TPA: malto-oligosyltrehalose synthase [Solirubrobacteraceae bacterium]|nr:malto-oligosyltrehalose synthase [Solirubrobacteraceae bacterium]
MTELRATYRLQLGGGLGFAHARELVPYLRDLGVSHVYLSPSFQARAGSTHGYDVVDPTSISQELGGEREFDALARAARDAGMGLILDIVPNHMATDDANRYWSDPELRRRYFDLDEQTGRHRRFFDIDHLAAVRQEDEAVFAETHKLALALVRDGTVDGLRIDHPDGLADPAGYLRRLRDGGARHVWVEKILDPGEHLRDWPVEGTVGYEFLNDVAAVFVDPAGEAPLTALWEEIAGDPRPFRAWADEAKLEQARTTFAPEVDRLRREAPRAVGGLERALASLPVYRTYVEPWSGEVAPEDRDAVAEAGLPESLARVLRLEERGWDAFVTRFQQTTPPVMAKGVEDTAFYRYARLLALNDVGGDPGRFGISVERFHAANAERAARFPNNLLVTQTHDTKRSGDVRARIGALSTMPAEWASHVRRWLELTADLVEVGGVDIIERYFVFQTLAGAWPIERERLGAYMEKALREAKRTTSWVEPDEAHEAAVRAFVAALYDHEAFLADFEPFAAELALAGDRAALGQLLLKLTVPGLPDIYQGDELLSLSLVDPDNRRPVDWERRRRLLDELRRGAAPTDESRKLWLVMRALVLRRTHARAFAGSYEPLEAGNDTVAFLRGGDVLAATAIRGDGETLALPPGRWRDVLHGGEHQGGTAVPLRDGIALLERA